MTYEGKVIVDLLEEIKTQIKRRIAAYLRKAGQKKVKQIPKLKHQAKADALWVEVERLDKIIKHLKEKEIIVNSKETETGKFFDEEKATSANVTDVTNEANVLNEEEEDGVVHAFEHALPLLKQGKNIARKVWKETGLHLEYYLPNENSKAEPHILMVNKDGGFNFWTVNPQDIVVEDWFVVI